MHYYGNQDEIGSLFKNYFSRWSKRTSGVPCSLRKWRRPAVKEKSSASFCGFGSRIRDKDWFLECIVMYGSPSMPASKDLSSILFAGNYPQEQPMSSGGLLRYRSAPSSLLGELRQDFLPVSSPPCPETATSAAMFSRFLAEDSQIRGGAVTNQPLPQFTTPASAERSGALFSPASQQQQQQQQQQLARVMEQTKNGAAATGSSNLVRQRSSPAGVLSHLNANAGYPNISKNQISFPTIRTPIMSQISEAVIAGSSSDDSSGYISRFPSSNWENFSRGKNTIDDNLNPTELEARNHAPTLPHQFSLPPKPSPETAAAMENYLHFQDSVPCKIRAKRGCATHPRSIAERVRRTRISERIKKLQELVPNMDTQTNTADMLALAISYIKDLQEQVQTLSESRSSCTCSSGKQKQIDQLEK